ncbi:MBL fold metallo-hydrolase [Egicoccus sp. AB-alg2]|uniref:MBL fold metallo-hydrolase n=1 Tax=Egicoccus sp. AB-alg2 TaxID=3242693 RepID=UPI00359EA1D2
MTSPPLPPPDPRAAWSLPAFGAMPPVARLDEVTTRVLAPNPSPMTLDGTNTYLLSRPGSGVAVVVDPGPDDAAHFGRVQDVAAELDAAVAIIVVTHHHVDHAEAAAAWAGRFGATVVAAHPEVAGPAGRLVADGDHVDVGGLHLEVLATPGHTADHVALRAPTGAVLTGDHVLGRGTSVVAHPDGDLAAYLDSLRKLAAVGPDALLPGHGPELTEDPDAVLTYYREHRAFRRGQILAALGEGPMTPRQLVERIYAEVDPRLWPAAEASTRAALQVLAGEQRVAWEPDDRVQLLS